MNTGELMFPCVARHGAARKSAYFSEYSNSVLFKLILVIRTLLYHVMEFVLELREQTPVRRVSRVQARDSEF